VFFEIKPALSFILSHLENGKNCTKKGKRERNGTENRKGNKERKGYLVS
jgi:hypothetical protein